MEYEVYGYHETPVRVRFGEVDRYGYMWHGHALAYFETGRADLARKFELSASTLLGAGLAVPMVNMYCDFKAPAYDDERLVVQTTLARPQLRLPMLRFEYRIVKEQSNVEVLRGRTEQLFVQVSGKALTRLPDTIQARLANGWEYLSQCPRWSDHQTAHRDAEQ